MAMWNPWRGCKKCSDGCLHCYIHKGDAKRGVDTSEIIRTKDFAKPTERLKNGNYKMKSGIVYTCFSTDFLIEEADGWRTECWKMMKERQDCTFLFLTKRIERFMECIPDDWNNGTVIDRAATKILSEKQETCFSMLSKTKCAYPRMGQKLGLAFPGFSPESRRRALTTP